jgi:CheY-like chemotaxis protein
MTRRKITVLQDNDSWNQFLSEAFEDTSSSLQFHREGSRALIELRQGNPDVVFANPSLITKPVGAALGALRSAQPDFRLLSLGRAAEANPLYRFDACFESSPPSLSDFQKELVRHLRLPDPIRLLVVDDEEEVGELFRDYFDHRTEPSFKVEVARSGEEGLRQAQGNPPHVLILDIKMPGLDGREVFRELTQKGIAPPTVIFFDLVSADEVLEIRRWGKPAFVEKGSRASAMPEIAPLIKKLAYFG